MKPIVLNETVEKHIPSAKELYEAGKRAEARLKQGDRAGAYLELYQVTGNEQLLLQAQVTSYSGAPGGMALAANYQIKVLNPNLYQLTLDRFSMEIVDNVVNKALDCARDNTPELFNTKTIRDSDQKIWTKYHMEKLFPGRIQQIQQNPDVADSKGSQFAILAQDDAELGRRPIEYANNSNYAIHEGKRFVTVIDKATNNIIVFFDKSFDSTRGTAVDGGPRDMDMPQIDNKNPSTRVLSERLLKMQYTQAGHMVKLEALPKFDNQQTQFPENLDRVFEFKGKLYQFDDLKTLQKFGVDFSKMIRGSMGEGIDYMKGLRKSGHHVEEFSDPNNPTTTALFGKLEKQGIIKPLSKDETKNYLNAIEQLRKQDLPSPYHNQYDSFRNLRNHLLKSEWFQSFSLWILADNTQKSELDKFSAHSQTEPKSVPGKVYQSIMEASKKSLAQSPILPKDHSTEHGMG